MNIPSRRILALGLGATTAVLCVDFTTTSLGMIFPVAATAVCAVVVALAAIAGAIPRVRPLSILAGSVMGVVCFVSAESILPARKEFVRNVGRLEAGMTRDEVGYIMSKAAHGHPYVAVLDREGIRRFAESEGVEYFHHAGTAFNKDYCMVTYKGDIAQEIVLGLD